MINKKFKWIYSGFLLRYTGNNPITIIVITGFYNKYHRILIYSISDLNMENKGGIDNAK
jgi:hypothetical protein